jgi:hypothetical protein
MAGAGDILGAVTSKIAQGTIGGLTDAVRGLFKPKKKAEDKHEADMRRLESKAARQQNLGGK